MKIAVTAKFIPRSPGASGAGLPCRADDCFGHGRLSEFDEYAVEAALQLKESSGAYVLVVTMGSAHAGEAIRKALEMGADEAVHIVDDAIRGSDAVSTSKVLARAIEKIGGVDMVLSGMTSADGGMGVMSAMLAERLGLPQLTYADRMEVRDGRVRIRRDAGSDLQVISADLPAVISVSDRINEPRYPTFREIMAARTKPITIWSLADLGISVDEVGPRAARTVVHSVTPRETRRPGPVVRDDGRGDELLAEFLLRGGYVTGEAAVLDLAESDHRSDHRSEVEQLS